MKSPAARPRISNAPLASVIACAPLVIMPSTITMRRAPVASDADTATAGTGLPFASTTRPAIDAPGVTCTTTSPLAGTSAAAEPASPLAQRADTCAVPGATGPSVNSPSLPVSAAAGISMSSSASPPISSCTLHGWRGSTWPARRAARRTCTSTPTTSLAPSSIAVVPPGTWSGARAVSAQRSGGRPSSSNVPSEPAVASPPSRPVPIAVTVAPPTSAPASSRTTPRTTGPVPTRISTSVTCSATPRPTHGRRARPARAGDAVHAVRARAQARDAERAVGAGGRGARAAGLGERDRGAVAARLDARTRDRLARVLRRARCPR